MEERTYSSDIAAAIRQFLEDEDDGDFSFDEEKGQFRFGANLSGKLKALIYLVLVHANAYTVYATIPFGAEADDSRMMASMADFICRANYGLRHGNFELDMRDGEIRYKYSVYCEGITPTQEMVKSSLCTPALMVERYGDGLLGIIFGDMSAEDAIDKCEKGPDELLAMLQAHLEAEKSGDHED